MSNQTPLERYQAALATGDFSEDAVQLAAVTYMDNLYHEIIKSQDSSGGGWFSSLFKSKPVMQKGLYMWGGVGRGKTPLYAACSARISGTSRAG